MKKKELKSVVKQLLDTVAEQNVRLTKLEYPTIVEKKELVVGKWYKYVEDDGNVFIFNHQKNGKSFGWFKGKWSIPVWYTDTFVNKKDLIEPTPQEVESALIKEAKRLGHKYDAYSWNHEQNTLYGNRGNDVGHDILFENGVWSEVKPEEKKTLSIEDIEKKVVKFAESVNWDFDKVINNIDTSDEVINWEEYNVLKGEYSSGKTRYIFDKYNKPNVGDLVVMYNSSGKFMCIKNLTEFDKMNSELCPELVSYKLATKELVFDLLFNK